MTTLPEPTQTIDVSGPDAAQGFESVQALLDTLEAVVVKLSPDGRIDEVNRACGKLSGFSSADLQGRHICDAFAVPKESSQFQADIRKMTEQVLPVRFESQLVTREGALRQVRWSGTSVSAGECLLLTGIDVTSEREALSRLAKAEALLAEHSRKEKESPASTPAFPSAEGERRSVPRRQYPHAQEMAWFIDDKLPDDEAFTRARCLDISSQGFAFVTPQPPPSDKVVIRLGFGAKPVFLVAKVIHSQLAQCDGKAVYRVGCRFVGRAKYESPPQ